MIIMRYFVKLINSSWTCFAVICNQLNVTCRMRLERRQLIIHQYHLRLFLLHQPPLLPHFLMVSILISWYVLCFYFLLLFKDSFAHHIRLNLWTFLARHHTNIYIYIFGSMIYHYCLYIVFSMLIKYDLYMQVAS